MKTFEHQFKNVQQKLYGKFLVNILEMVFNFSLSTDFILLTFQYSQFSHKNKETTLPSILHPTSAATLFPTLQGQCFE